MLSIGKIYDCYRENTAVFNNTKKKKLIDEVYESLAEKLLRFLCVAAVRIFSNYFNQKMIKNEKFTEVYSFTSTTKLKRTIDKLINSLRKSR